MRDALWIPDEARADASEMHKYFDSTVTLKYLADLIFGANAEIHVSRCKVFHDCHSDSPFL